MKTQIIAIVIAFLILVFIIDLIRRQRMTFKYSLAWLSASGIVIFFAINKPLLSKISKMLGFTIPSNFIFFVMLIFSVFFGLMLTLYINEQNNRSESLAQSVGILEYKLKQLEEKIGKK